MLGGGQRRLSGDLVVLAALGDLLGDVLPDLAALGREVERDDRLPTAARAVVDVLLGVLDVGAHERRVVVEDVPARDVVVLRGRAVGVLGAHDDRPRLDLDDLLVGRGLLLGLVGEEVGAVLLRPGDDLLVLRVQQVPGAVRRGGVRVARRALGGELDGVVERQRRRRVTRLRAARDAGVARVGLATRPHDVGLPVVEVQLGDLADLLFGALGVGDVRERDVDLVRPGTLDLRLGDAEVVDALAHDVDRAVDRVRRDRRLLGRLGLVDQLDAALEVQAALGRLGQDDRQRAGQEQADEQQDAEVPGAVVHQDALAALTGVRTISSPPSSS